MFCLDHSLLYRIFVIDGYSMLWRVILFWKVVIGVYGGL